MYISEVEITNMFGCKFSRLQFSPERVYVVQCVGECPIRPLLCTVVQLVLSAKFANIESLAPLGDLYMGNVKLVFYIQAKDDMGPELSADMKSDEAEHEQNDEPCTSKQAKQREERRKLLEKQKNELKLLETKKLYKISATRDFLVDPEVITYSINDGPLESCKAHIFQWRFQTNVEFMKAGTNEIDILKESHWILPLFRELSDQWNMENLEMDPFERFVELYHATELEGAGEQDPVGDQLNNQQKNFLDFPSKLTTACLSINSAVNLVRRTYALKVLNTTQQIFEYVLANEYTVWFLIPFVGGVASVDEVSLEMIDLQQMRPCIHRVADKKQRVFDWVEADRVSQDVLLIAFQLALAFRCQQKIIYLRNLDTIAEYQTMQMATAAILHDKDEGKTDWPDVNYLQRIIDVCYSLKVTAIIEYPGGIPTAPGKANFIKSRSFITDQGEEWFLEQHKVETCSWEKFVGIIENFLKKKINPEDP